jgi:sulfoxide reductase heme-binding subunit YedZ
MSDRNFMRLKQHVLLAILTALLLWLCHSSIPGKDPKFLWSMATGYTSFILLGATLILGPLRVMQKRNNPVSSDLRRDVGIWCGFTGIAHVIVGIQVHMGNIWLYFVKPIADTDQFRLRADLFGTANYVGLAATLILLVLLLLSNDVSLRLLRPMRWKRLQQSSYVLLLFVFAHGVMYQVIEKRNTSLVVVYACLLVMPMVFQAIGYGIVSAKKKDREIG